MSIRRKVHKHYKMMLGVVCACVLISGLLFHELVITYWFKVRLLPSDPLSWDVKVTVRDLNEVQHIIFVKVHKAASSTLFSILIRFSLSRKLNVMFPRDNHLLSEKSIRLNPLLPHPSSPPFLFDILCNHVIFDEDQLSRFFPVDRIYVTILREPLNQVRSAYDYYRNTHYRESYLTRTANFTDFLSNPSRYEPEDPYISFTNNRMSLDLGLPIQQIRNSSYVREFLQKVANVFDLVLIAERFDESMILLKRRLRWTLKDVLYARLNQRKVKISDDLDPSLEVSFQRFAHFDIALYGHFSKVFDELVRKEGLDFQDEVNNFRGILQTVQNFCELSKHSQGQLIIPRRKWNQQFEFESSECETIALEDLVLDQRAKYWQLRRLNLWS